jgi:hypothetical protein
MKFCANESKWRDDNERNLWNKILKLLFEVFFFVNFGLEKLVIEINTSVYYIQITIKDSQLYETYPILFSFQLKRRFTLSSPLITFSSSLSKGRVGV